MPYLKLMGESTPFNQREQTIINGAAEQSTGNAHLGSYISIDLQM